MHEVVTNGPDRIKANPTKIQQHPTKSNQIRPKKTVQPGSRRRPLDQHWRGRTSISVARVGSWGNAARMNGRSKGLSDRNTFLTCFTDERGSGLAENLRLSSPMSANGRKNVASAARGRCAQPPGDSEMHEVMKKGNRPSLFSNGGRTLARGAQRHRLTDGEALRVACGPQQDDVRACGAS